MKRVLNRLNQLNLVLCSLVIITLMSGMVIAEDTTTGATGADVSKGQQLIDSIKNTPENPLDRTVTIPDYLKTPASIIFGVSENISLEVLIILLMVWIIFFVIMVNILKLVPLFDKEWTALLGAFALATLMGLTGAIKFAAEFFLGIGNLFEFLGRWSPGAIIFALVLVAAIFAVVSKILGIFRGMKREADIEKAKSKGAEIGAQLGFMKSMGNMFDFTNTTMHSAGSSTGRRVGSSISKLKSMRS